MGVREMVVATVLLTATAARAAEPPKGALDAEMLRDLDVLGSPSYARDRELGRKMSVIERLRMLEVLRQMETDPASGTLPAGHPPTSPSASPREVK